MAQTNVKKIVKVQGRVKTTNPLENDDAVNKGFLENQNFIKNSFPSLSVGNFQQRLQLTIDEANEGDIIDARIAEPDGIDSVTGYNVFVIENTIIIDKPLTILLPTGLIKGDDLPNGANMFNIESSMVTIKGNGRSSRNDLRMNTTVLEINTPNKGYHFYARGQNIINISDMDMFGVRTTNYNAQEDNPLNPIDGSGGIYIEKPNPGTTTGGNTVQNIILENLLISGTKYHGIYLDTPILCSIKDVRISQGGGHGIFLNGGTSTRIENCYVSSTHKGGFVLSGHSYSTLISCASEYSGIGYWLRGSFNISLISCGAEMNGNRSANVPNGNVTTTDENGNPVIISDVGGDNTGLFRGSSYVVTGGRNIVFQNCASTNAGRPDSVNGYTNTTRDFAILGNARNISVQSPRTNLSSGNTSQARFNIAFMTFAGGTPSDCELIYNPIAEGYVPVGASGVISSTNNAANQAPVFIQEGSNTVVRYGTIFLTKTQVPDATNNDDAINLAQLNNRINQLVSTYTAPSSGEMVIQDSDLGSIKTFFINNEVDDSIQFRIPEPENHTGKELIFKIKRSSSPPAYSFSIRTVSNSLKFNQKGDIPPVNLIGTASGGVIRIMSDGDYWQEL